MKTKILDNGIRIKTIPLSGLKAVTTEVFVKIGSKYEEIGEHGLSHFLEHMAFKGTPKRPTPSAINKELDSRGATWNAGTGEEYTSYHITSVWDNIDWSIELLADILQNPLIDKQETTKERGVVVEEIKMYQDNPMMGMSGDFYQEIFGESERGCFDVTGDVEEILSYSRDNLVNYREKLLNPKNMVIVVSGNLENEEKVMEIVEQYWRNWKKTENDLPLSALKWGSKHDFKISKQVEQGHFCLGVQGLARGDVRKPQLKVLETILCGNSSSKLFEEIREKRGWAYYVHSIGSSLSDTGLIGVQSGVKQSETSSALELSEQIIRSMSKWVTEDEVVMAKNYLKGKYELLLDESDFWTGYVGEKWLLEDSEELPLDSIKKIESVTLGGVQELASQVLETGEMYRMVISK